MLVLRRSFSTGKKFQRGQSATEFIIIAPVIFMLVFGCLQFALIYQAKTTLTYAAFTAARIGSVNKATLSSVRRGFAMGMAPFFTTDNNSFNVTDAVTKVNDLVMTGYVRFERLNPTDMAFGDSWVRPDADDNTLDAIPNDNLMYRDAGVGSSRVSIQDANLLKIRVTFCYHLSFPVIRKVIQTVVQQFSIGYQQLNCAASTGDKYTIPITSTAIIRMQSDAVNDPAWAQWPYGDNSSGLFNLGTAGSFPGSVSRNPDAEQ